MIGLFTLWKLRDKWHNDINDRLNAIMKMVCRPEDELSVLCDIYGSDKGSMYRQAHTYTSEYYKLFSENRDNIKSVFECGIGTNNPKLASSMGRTGRPGASLRVWRDYFRNAVVIGADIDRDILFDEDRIHTGYIDQTNPQEVEIFFRSLVLTPPLPPPSFDIMIDDGLHTFEAAVCLFENSFQYLNNGGYYVIEDMPYEKIPNFEEYFSSCKFRDNIGVNYILNAAKWRVDDNLIVIQRR
jgi:SAM-dependent methyltransferase